MDDHAELVAGVRQEMRELRSSMDRGFERLDQKTDRHFLWLVGIIIGTFTTLMTMLLRLTAAASGS